METEIVISGISGRFPEADNVTEFSEKLFNKVDMVTETRRWVPGLFGLPRKIGQLKDIGKFDNTFFAVGEKSAHWFDPQLRMLLELTHETIIDAGYDPKELRGRKIGVFLGNALAESHELFNQDPEKVSVYALMGSRRSMLSNQINFFFDFKGPSVSLDSACSSSLYTLHTAVRAIQNDDCESAIVAASNICLKPHSSIQLNDLKSTSIDGSCKAFDDSCNGYCRSEACVTLLLQKSNVARRKYASIVHIKSNSDGFKTQGLAHPSVVMQKTLIKEVYNECKLDPLNVTFVEAHGTGTVVGDPVEISALSDILCSGRVKPLLVGSVKSNMGHSEAASGLCSIVKVIISMEKCLIPPNLHFYKPNSEIKALVDGKVKVVAETTPLEGDYVAINNFGAGGTNAHAVLKANTCERTPTPIADMTVPQLALYSGRTEASVQFLLDYLQREKLSREFFALLHKSVYSRAIDKPFRGYILLQKKPKVYEIKALKELNRPVWYIFSGMGSFWPCMAKQLMNLEVFGNSIRRSANFLKPYGLNLIHLLTNSDKVECSSKFMTTHFVCIVSVQIALFDVLKEIGITADGIIGHSMGEISCAYADGCLTAEQTILSAYWRGKVTEGANLERGAMAAVGMTWPEAVNFCPKDVFPSCYNAEDSVTLSGPKDSMKALIDSLKAKNVFVQEVNCCEYAWHSPYIFPVSRKLQTELEKIIPNPKFRSNLWISSSYPKEELDNPAAKLADASYFVHNLVSPVLFYEAVRNVPKKAIVIEIAPHHLMQTILQKTIGPDAEYISLMKNHTDNTVHLLSSLGRLYTVGMNPDIEKLYPEVQYPVPKGTPMIAPLMKWDHSENWTVAKWDEDSYRFQKTIEINVSSEESSDKFILDHCLDGENLYPATGYLVLVWKALASIMRKEYESLPVAFEEVKFHKSTVLSEEASNKLLLQITKVGGQFEISEEDMLVCNGRIYFHGEGKTDVPELFKSNQWTAFPLNSNDIYKELKLRGYEHGPTFKGVIAASIEGSVAYLFKEV